VNAVYLWMSACTCPLCAVHAVDEFVQCFSESWCGLLSNYFGHLLMISFSFLGIFTVLHSVISWECINWRYVALVIVLWHPALSSSSSASVTALRWEPVNVHVLSFGVRIGLEPS